VKPEPLIVDHLAGVIRGAAIVRPGRRNDGEADLPESLIAAAELAIRSSEGGTRPLPSADLVAERYRGLAPTAAARLDELLALFFGDGDVPSYLDRLDGLVVRLLHPAEEQRLRINLRDEPGAFLGVLRSARCNGDGTLRADLHLSDQMRLRDPMTVKATLLSLAAETPWDLAFSLAWHPTLGAHNGHPGKVAVVAADLLLPPKRPAANTAGLLGAWDVPIRAIGAAGLNLAAARRWWEGQAERWFGVGFTWTDRDGTRIHVHSASGSLLGFDRGIRGGFDRSRYRGPGGVPPSNETHSRVLAAPAERRGAEVLLPFWFRRGRRPSRFSRLRPPVFPDVRPIALVRPGEDRMSEAGVTGIGSILLRDGIQRPYLAGPMRGRPRFNFAAFDGLREDLRGAGLDPVCPAEGDRRIGFDPDAHGEPWQEPTEFDLRACLRRNLAGLFTADAVVLLPGWQSSRGAVAEVAVAQFLGLPVYGPDGELQSLLSSSTTIQR
jgi:hypothetical protein